MNTLLVSIERSGTMIPVGTIIGDDPADASSPIGLNLSGRATPRPYPSAFRCARSGMEARILQSGGIKSIKQSI